MERITKKNKLGDYYYPMCFSKCDGLGSSSNCDRCECVHAACKKLGGLEDLEELLGIPLEELAKIFRQHIPDDCKRPHKAIVLTDGDVDKWREYKAFEKDDRLIKLPCKVGDTVYVNGVLGYGEAEKYKVIRVDYHSTLETGRNEFYIEALLDGQPNNSIGFYDKEFSKSVFLTKEQAEEKQKELRDRENCIKTHSYIMQRFMRKE